MIERLVGWQFDNLMGWFKKSGRMKRVRDLRRWRNKRNIDKTRSKKKEEKSGGDQRSKKRKKKK